MMPLSLRQELLASAELTDAVSQAIEKGRTEVALVDEKRQELERYDLPTLLGMISSKLRLLAEEVGDTPR